MFVEQKLKISVAMCTFNGAAFLLDQLTSIASQQRQPDELVVYDDCSSDNTLELLRQFSAASPFPVRICLNQERVGSTQNFELAIAACNGEVIALCDQDDIWELNKLEVIERHFLDDPETSLVFTDASLVDEHAAPLGKNLWESLRFDEAAQEQIQSKSAFELLIQRQVVTGATMAFRSSFRDLVLPIPEKIPLIHDGWIALMISLAGKLVPVRSTLIKYRQHEAQQLGAIVMGTLPQGFVARAKRHYSYAGELKKLEAVNERVQSRNSNYKFFIQDGFAERLKHIRSRAALSERRLSNIPAAFVELFAGRYHRYSHGFSSFLKDVVR
jgi:glycosyltransferase involved in cell wall biosynthesis